MTNEQLALLLRFIADRLVRELDALDESLPEGVERRSEWWYEDTPLMFASYSVRTFFRSLGESERSEQGYKLRPTGICIPLEELYKFADELAEWNPARDLEGKE